MNEFMPRHLSYHQPSLFDDEPRHDYGNALGDNDEMGHEFPFVRAGASEVVVSPALEQPGASVSLAGRKLALEAVARLYGKHNQGKGMKKAVTMAAHRRTIEPRYVDVDYVAEHAEINGRYTPEQERAILQPILKEQELVAAGFDDADVDLMAKSVIYEARQRFGVEVRSNERQRNLKKIK